MSVNCAIWCNGSFQGSYTMSGSEYDELESLCSGSMIEVATINNRGKKVPFAQVKAQVLSHLAAPTDSEIDRRECYPDDRDIPKTDPGFEAFRRKAEQERLEEWVDEAQGS